MTSRVSRQTMKFQDVRIRSYGTAAGPKESTGPLGNYFDITHQDNYIGQETWEKAEKKLLEEAIQRAIENGGYVPEEMDTIFAGDLLNQIISATFASRTVQIPFVGMYGACSTSMLTLAHAAAHVNANYADLAVAACSSHNSTAEKQFRYPTEYGAQKPATAQYTATGAGACIVGRGGKGIKITYATLGKVVDMGIKNPFDMGTAMAPAAADTLIAHLKDTGRVPADYDLIVTGDLAGIGAPILQKLMQEQGYDISPVYNDCGLMLYKKDDPEVFAGGSGCASSALVTYGYLLREMEAGRLKKLLVVATGALLSPISYQQGESIPCIAHACAFELEE